MSTVHLSSGSHFDQTPFGKVRYGYNYRGDIIVAFHDLTGNYFMNYSHMGIANIVLDASAKAIFKIKKRK